VGDTSVPIMLSTRKTRVVHPPAADVGATIVCESEELLEPFLQETDWENPARYSRRLPGARVDLPTGRSYSAAWHRFPPVKPVEVAHNHWRWELKDMPALDLRDVKSRPEWAALAARMSVQWGDAALKAKTTSGAPSVSG